MKHTSSRSLAFALILLFVVFTTGCCGARRPVMYYNMSQMALAPQNSAAEQGKKIVLGIGPVQLPESLNRAQIATRLDDQRLTYSDYNRWSGALSEDFASILMEDLASLLPAQTPTAVFPWPKYFQPTHRLVVSVSQFDGKLGGEVVLTARWTITTGDGKTPLLTKKSTIRAQTNGSEYQALVAAQSHAVAKLSAEIITALSTL